MMLMVLESELMQITVDDVNKGSLSNGGTNISGLFNLQVLRLQ